MSLSSSFHATGDLSDLVFRIIFTPHILSTIIDMFPLLVLLVD